MATASKRGKFIYEQVYEEDDLVDDFFFNELAKHIVLSKLTALVEHLDLPEAKFDFLQDFLVQTTSVQWVSSTTVWYDQYLLQISTLSVIFWIQFRRIPYLIKTYFNIGCSYVILSLSFFQLIVLSTTH